MVENRWVGVAGFVLVALLLLSFVFVSGGGLGAPEANRSDATILDWYTDSGNQTRYLLGSMIGGIGISAFLVFVIGLRRMLDRADSPPVVVELSYVAGLIVATLSFVEVAVGSSIAATFAFSDTFELDPDTARVVLMIGNIWLPAIDGIPKALFVGAACLAGRRSGSLPGWLTWTGFVLAPLSVLAYPGFGANSLLAVLWVLLVSIVLLRRRSREPGLETHAVTSHNP